ncbi:MAG: penicillin-binding protein 2, partial [Synechococcus sp. SB0676_bin_10]|nr:penicillin-binding protein 2 [Synechococcus sp. SB0676_bin_10]
MIGAPPLEGQLSRQVGLDQGKYRLLLRLVLVLVLVLSGRLFWLQIVQGERNRVRAQENSVRVAPSQPIRGQMLDRHGEVLASSHLVHKLYVWPKQAVDPNWRHLRQRLSTLLDVPEEELEKRRANARPGDYRIPLTDRLTPAQTIKLLEQVDELEGAEVGVDYLRAYPHGTMAAHALGYTSPITDEELYHLAGQGYRIQDRIGRTGLEAAYE